MNDNSTSKEKKEQYSDKYIAIRAQAETTWPAWKITTYNTNVAISAHARKLVKQG